METIGKYQIQKVLGHGGMGTVYEAIDPLINRKVALKMMVPGLVENPDLRKRFLREAQAAGGLRHRNIVTVYDLGEDKGQPYIAMEFIEGLDLEKLIQNKEPRSLVWKLDVLHQLCEGLAYAHKNGIVHRDVKPANLRVTHDGDVKIMDFGIAQLQSSTMTKGGLVLGTVHYMSPEQIEGHKVDHRADIFSVGAIAYELIAGKRPFDGESLTAVMFRVMNETPDTKPITTEFSPALDAVILRALARDVNARYQSLEQMAADIQAVLRRAAGDAPAASDPATQLSRLVEEGQQWLAKGDVEAAVARAREALVLAPGDAAARELLRIAEGEALSRRVGHVLYEMTRSMLRARADGQLQKALGFCRRLLELKPGDPEIAKLGAEIESVIHDREVEQLCGLARGYAGDGDLELANKIAAKIERLAPRSPRYLQLRKYLDAEAPRRIAEARVAEAQENVAQGNLAQAYAEAEDALKIQPDHVLAREIRDRAGAFLGKAPPATTAAVPAPPAPPPPPKPAAQARPPAPSPPLAPPSAPVASAPKPAVAVPGPVAAPSAKVAAPAPPLAAKPPTVASPVPAPSPKLAPAPAKPAAPEPAPAVPVAPAKASAVPPSAPVPAPEPTPQISAPPAAPTPEGVALASSLGVSPALAPAPAASESHRNEIEALTTKALNAFVENNYPKAKKALEKALALDPNNKKARELQKILGSLG